MIYSLLWGEKVSSEAVRRDYTATLPESLGVAFLDILTRMKSVQRPAILVTITIL